MQSARMTKETWEHLRTVRSRGAELAEARSHLDPACLSLYAPIARRHGPFVMAQVGQSLDGRVATPTGDAQDVSGCDGIAHLHRCRALVDAVIVGVGTVVADNPSLSVRAVDGKSPVRVVIDCNGRIPPDAKMLHDAGTPVLVVQADDVSPSSLPCDVIRMPRRGEGLHPQDILDALAGRDLTSILVEGGAKTIARFLDADLIDRLHISVAPIIIGSGPMGINLAPVERLCDARRPSVTVYDIGTDVVFDCNLHPATTSADVVEQGEHVLVTHPA